MILIAVALLAQALSSTTGELAGCVTDAEGKATPGAIIRISRGVVVVRTVNVDAAGCYQVANLSPDSYTIVAALRGFISGIEEEVVVAAGGRTVVNLKLRGALEIDWIAPSDDLQAIWRRADAVVHIRVIQGRRAYLSAPWARVTATVLDALKQHPTGGPSGPAMSFWQEQWADEPEPYAPGEELVLFLTWNSRLPENTFVRTYGPHAVFMVRNGRIEHGSTPVVNQRAGMTIEAFLAEIRALK